MPQHESAKKRMRQNEKRRKRNKSHKTRVRSKMQELRSLEDADEARELLNDVKGELDRLASKNIIHKNKAANYKSKLEKHVDNLESGDE
jgi:small subunit ribosomal protein S20